MWNSSLREVLALSPLLPAVKTIDAGLDAFLSVPIENFFSAAVALKSATTEAVGADSCNLVCTPSLATV